MHRLRRLCAGMPRVGDLCTRRSAGEVGRASPSASENFAVRRSLVTSEAVPDGLCCKAAESDRTELVAPSTYIHYIKDYLMAFKARRTEAMTAHLSMRRPPASHCFHALEGSTRSSRSAKYKRRLGSGIADYVRVTTTTERQEWRVGSAMYESPRRIKWASQLWRWARGGMLDEVLPEPRGNEAASAGGQLGISRTLLRTSILELDAAVMGYCRVSE